MGYIVAAGVAAAALIGLCARYAIVNDRLDYERLRKQSDRGSVTTNSGLESLTNGVPAEPAVDNSSDIQTLKDYYRAADSFYFGKGSRKYQESIKMCTEALDLIAAKGVCNHYTDDFLYKRGRAKCHTGDLDGAVGDFLAALANASLEKDPSHDQGIENQSNLALYQLLSGKYRVTARKALQRHFRAYGQEDQEKILGSLWHDKPRNEAYQILTGKK
jgi:tetratricopeptide (TPR) repeat protein